MQFDESDRDESVGPGLAATAVNVSAFGRPVWPRLLHESVGVEDRAEWVRERLWWADYMPNDVLAATTGQRFMDDVMARCDIAWGKYRIPTGQQDDVLAQLSLLHIRVRCIVEPDHGKNCEEDMSWHGVCPASMPH